MRTEPSTFRDQVPMFPGAAPGPELEDGVGEAAWWLSGGLLLLAWTGLALLLTNA